MKASCLVYKELRDNQSHSKSELHMAVNEQRNLDEKLTFSSNQFEKLKVDYQKSLEDNLTNKNELQKNEKDRLRFEGMVTAKN